jgi:hypothetical protein
MLCTLLLQITGCGQLDFVIVRRSVSRERNCVADLRVLSAAYEPQSNHELFA